MKHEAKTRLLDSRWTWSMLPSSAESDAFPDGNQTYRQGCSVDFVKKKKPSISRFFRNGLTQIRAEMAARLKEFVSCANTLRICRR
jgi:hypothetical protein